MRVDIYTNCGAQFDATIYGAANLDLATVPLTTSSYVPAAASEWEIKTFDLSNYVGEIIIIKFVNNNGYGNNLYLDNINITETATSSNYYPDLDMDNFGDINAAPVLVMAGDPPPTDHVLDNTDCDDTNGNIFPGNTDCLLYTSPSPRDATLSRMPSSA